VRTDGQIGQAYVPVPPKTNLDFESMCFPAAQLARRTLTGAVAVENNKVYQTVTMNGKVISQQSDGKRHPSVS
jgi:hypothetical protein